MRSERFLAFLIGCFLFSSCGENKEKSTTDTVSSDTTASVNSEPISTIVTSPQHLMIVKHRVGNYEKFLASYDAHDSLRLVNGIHNYVIGKKEGDPNMLLVTVKADNVDKAIAFSKDPTLKQAMQRAGVTGAPDISLITAVWQDTVKISSTVRSMTTFTVKDWDSWVKAFQEGKQERLDNGITDRLYGYDAANNKKVTLVTAIIDSAKASAYWKSDLLKDRRTKSGVIGMPDRFLFNIVKRY